MMNELKQAKETLEGNGYERKVVYKVVYMKDGKWFHSYFENNDDANMFIGAMKKWNQESDEYIYKCIMLKRFDREMFRTLIEQG